MIAGTLLVWGAWAARGHRHEARVDRRVRLIETVLGVMIILGLGTRYALIIGGLMMTALTFGTMFLGDFQLAWLQLTYAIAFFLLLAARSWNLISLDGMMSKGPRL